MLIPDPTNDSVSLSDDNTGMVRFTRDLSAISQDEEKAGSHRSVVPPVLKNHRNMVILPYFTNKQRDFL
jgi:hypothetical protein